MPKVFFACIFSLLSTLAWADKTLLVWGDSLSAGYGIAKEQAWPSLLQTRLKDNGFSYRVVNASVSGETSAGGRSRLPAALKQHQPQLVIIELGANDGLRGLPMTEMQNNLAAMIELCKRNGAKVLLVGMRIPPNYGIQYTQAFSGSFKQLSTQYRTGLVPFLFDGIAGKPDAFLPDGLHPSAESQSILLNNVWPQLKPLLN